MKCFSTLLCFQTDQLHCYRANASAEEYTPEEAPATGRRVGLALTDIKRKERSWVVLVDTVVDMYE
jgi:hypothetical protein